MSAQSQVLGLDAKRQRASLRERMIGAVPQLDAARWAVYYQDTHLAMVGVPRQVALQIAKQVSSAVVITMEAAGRVAHQHELGQTSCQDCS